MNWDKKKLGDLCFIGRGSSPRPIANPAYFTGGTIPWIKIADATSSVKFIYETKEYVNDYGASFSRKLQPGSLILAASGTLGFPMFLGVEGCIHDGWLYFDELKDIDKIFLYYKLITLRDYFNGRASGAAIQNINTGILKEVETEIPPLPIQRKIASILSAYDDLIENNLKRIKLLEEKAFLRYKEIVTSEKLEPVKLKDVAVVNQSSLKSNSDIEKLLYVDIASVSTGSIDNKTEYDLKEAPGRAKRILKHHDIIWSCVRPNRKSYSFVWRPEENLIGSTGFAVISAKTIPATFLYQLITTNDFVSYLENHAKGATYPAVTASDFEDATLLICSKNIMDEYHEEVNQLFELKYVLQKQNTKLQEARDILLPKLMNGQIEV